MHHARSTSSYTALVYTPSSLENETTAYAYSFYLLLFIWSGQIMRQGIESGSQSFPDVVSFSTVELFTISHTIAYSSRTSPLMPGFPPSVTSRKHVLMRPNRRTTQRGNQHWCAGHSGRPPHSGHNQVTCSFSSYRKKGMTTSAMVEQWNAI